MSCKNLFIKNRYLASQEIGRRDVINRNTHKLFYLYSGKATSVLCDRHDPREHFPLGFSTGQIWPVNLAPNAISGRLSKRF